MFGRIPYPGNFKDKMDTSEAALVLGLRQSSNKKKIEERYRKIMMLNHPDQGKLQNLFKQKKKSGNGSTKSVLRVFIIHPVRSSSSLTDFFPITISVWFVFTLNVKFWLYLPCHHGWGGGRYTCDTTPLQSALRLLIFVPF